MTTGPEQAHPLKEMDSEPRAGTHTGDAGETGQGAVRGGHSVEGADTPYLFVAAQLREQIASGVLRPGDRLPSSRELEGRFGHANMTVRRGVDVLRAEGLIYTVHGVGSFVGPRASGPGPSPGTPRRPWKRPAQTSRPVRPGDDGLSQQLAQLAERVQALEEALWGAGQP